MAEPIKGKLIWKGEGKDKKRLLSWINKRGEMTIPNRFSEDQLATELLDSQENEIDVHLELENGQPRRIRPAGQDWQEPAPAVRVAPIERAERNSPRDQRDNRRREDDRSRKPGDQTRRENMRSDQTTNQNLPREFHNPYNFVPAIPRHHIDGKVNDLGDRKPRGHDRFLADKYTGKLHVKMTVVTPLLLPDTARVEISGEHKSFPVRVDEAGKPDINPTAIKGMLRSDYEAVTNSRLSVFKDHDERLAFRMESTEGAMSVPARIENGKVVLYTGTTRIDDNGRPPQNGVLCAAWLPTYDKRECRIGANAVKVIDDGNRLPKHGEEVLAWLEKFQHYRWVGSRQNGSYKPGFQYWRVVGTMATEEENLGSAPSETPSTPVPGSWQGNSFHTSLGQSLKKVSGYVCITGNNQGKVNEPGPNIENKHDERLFFNENNKPTFDTHNLPVTVIEEWNILIKNYRVQHDNGKGGLEEPATARRGNQAIQLQWSRQIRDTKIGETSKDSKLQKETLKDETLCYARVKLNNGKYQVLELYPVTISRRVHQVSPDSLLPDCLKPAGSIELLSSADRMFGWVRQGKGKSDQGAYRGQLRIGGIDYSKENKDDHKPIEEFDIEEFEKIGLPLQILGQPKPQQGRFYVARNQCGDAQPDRLKTEEAGYQAGKGLRGRKVYPHHSALTEEYWKPKWQEGQEAWQADGQTRFQEYLHPKKKDKDTGQWEDQRGSQNRSIKGWVNPKTVFEFDIHFINLSGVELGALLWLLDMKKYADKASESFDYLHRFGGGKPLGFGSMRLELDTGKSDIKSGEELAEGRYASLEDDALMCEEARVKSCIEAFQNAVASAYGGKFEEVKFIKAFLQVSRGFDTGFPIHYPRTREEGTTDHPSPNPEGESFKWFVENSRTETRTNQTTKQKDTIAKNGYALPDLDAEIGLPILEHKAERQQRNNQGQRRNPRRQGGGRR